MVAHGLEQAKGTCTFDCKPMGSGLLGEKQKSTRKSAYHSYKVWFKKNRTDVWPYNSKTINSTAKWLFIRSKGIVERIKMRYGTSL